MITIKQYVGPHADSKDWTAARQLNATELLLACERLEKLAVADGIEFPINPHTGSGVSGDTLGGFRPKSCPIGAPNSAHKEGFAVDRYDPHNLIDAWCMANLDKLAACGIYLEHPAKTNAWSHWTTRAPLSKNRVFMP